MNNLLSRVQDLQSRLRGSPAESIDVIEALIDLADLIVELIPAEGPKQSGGHPIQGKRKKKKRGRLDRMDNAGNITFSRAHNVEEAPRKLTDVGIEFVCNDKTGNHLMVYRGTARFDLWPSTGRWGRSQDGKPPKETRVTTLAEFIAEVLKTPSLLPTPGENGGFPAYRYADGSAIYRYEGCPGWRAHWADRTPLRGEDPRTGQEVDWYFKTAAQAAVALLEGGEGPRREPKA